MEMMDSRITFEDSIFVGMTPSRRQYPVTRDIKLDNFPTLTGTILNGSGQSNDKTSAVPSTAPLGRPSFSSISNLFGSHETRERPAAS
jgi:hypothetical protein